MIEYVVGAGLALGVFAVLHLVSTVKNGRRRRRARAGLAQGETYDVPHVLALAGLTHSLREGHEVVGGRGVIDGVTVEAIEQTQSIGLRDFVGGSGSSELRYLVRVSLAPLAPEVRLTQRGVSTTSPLELGDEAFDSRFALSGPLSVAVPILDRAARDALRAAIDAGWRVEGDHLERHEGDDTYVVDILPKGLAAAKALQVVDEAARLLAIAAHDPIPRMRRRALLLLVTRHAGRAEAKYRSANDPVLRLFAAWRDPDWVEQARDALGGGVGVIEIAEALAERTEPSAYVLVTEFLTASVVGEERVALEAAHDRLRAKTVAAAGTLAVADHEAGGLALASVEVDAVAHEAEAKRVVETA